METTLIESAVQIINLQGRAFIIDANGVTQTVSVGQVLAKGAVLLTDANTQITYAEASSNPVASPVNNEVVSSANNDGADAAAQINSGDIAAMQAAILAGQDPTQIFEAPAAGNAQPSGVFNGSSGNAGFVVVDRVGDSLLAQAGFDTLFTNGGPSTREDAFTLFTADDPSIVEESPTNFIPELTIIINPPLTPNNSFPQGVNNTAFVDESALNNGSNPSSDNESASGRFVINTGPDGLGKFELQQADGSWVDVTAGGQVIGQYGTVTVTVVDGEYQWRYDLNGALDHPDSNTTGIDDLLGESFLARVTDGDGDQAIGQLNIRILDDGPLAEVDTNSVNEGGAITGDVLENDVFGADGAASGGGVVGVKVGADITAPATGNVGTELTGTYGTLTLNANGSYTYTSNANSVPPSGATEVFTYTIQDGDGDLSTTTLTITLSDSGLTIEDAPSPVVYEKALDLERGGNDLAGGTVVGSDPDDPRETATGQLAATGGSGVLIYALVGSIQGAYGQIKLNADGSYIYTLMKPVASNTGNDGINTELGKESFSYTVTDANGNSQQGTISINIVDDVPEAKSDSATLQDGGVVSGDVLANDVFGADGAATGGGVVGVKVGADITAPATGNVGTELTGTYGTLTLNANGSYTYTSNANSTPPSGATEVFTYTIQDGDGDLSSTTLTINVPGSGEPTEPELVDPVLVVGSNANDNATQTKPHTVPSDDTANHGEIKGGKGHDVLVGDTGLSQVQGQTANLILVLDSSGSMSEQIQFGGTSISRMDALLQATEALLQSLSESGASNVRINLIDFDSTAKSLGVFDLVIEGIVNIAGLNDAKAALVGMTAGGSTNYEDGLQTALDWITETGANAPHANADFSQVLFISDGAPNAWNTAQGGIEGGYVSAIDTTIALGQVLGTDGSNEVQQIVQAGWNIEAIGIGLSNDDFSLGAHKLESINVGQNNKGYLIKDINGLQLALVSAWKASGDLIQSTALGINTGIANGFIGASTQSGGVLNSGLSQGQMLRFDFSTGTDYDGAGAYKNNGFNGPLTGAATFDFRGFDNSTHLSYRVFYMDGTNSSEVSINGRSRVDIKAAGGKVIDYIEFNVLGTTSAGYIKLAAITALSALAILDQIEGLNGQAINIDNTEQLVDAVGALGGGMGLNPAGNDTIIGGDGDDIIFGDVLFTDLLAQAAGLNTLPGDGWKVFSQLEAGQGLGTFEGWDRSDTLSYIKDTAHHQELATESGRLGGHDILLGGAGDDIIFGQEGDDLINGGLGDNILSGGSGNDTFQFTDADAGSTNIIIDFGEGKDVLDLQDLLIGEHSGNISEYLNFRLEGNDTLLTVSPSGSGDDVQQIRFQGIDLLAMHNVSDSASLIDSMLIDQSLIISQ